MLDAVRFAHERGVVHRDLKPGHLLIDREGRPRLLDFGISKLVDPETNQSLALTRTESRALTPAYASPEQFRGEPVTPASDVYALGTILYELLAGRRPFAGDQGSAVALERAVLGTDPEPPSTAARQVASALPGRDPKAPRALPFAVLTRDLDAICLKALRKAPLERYADAGELAADLRRYLAGQPVAARRGGRRYRLARFAQRNRAPLAVAGALLVAVVALWAAVDAGRRAEVALPEPPAPRPFPFTGIGSLPLDELRRDFVESPASAEAGAALVLGLAKADQFDERGSSSPGSGRSPVKSSTRSPTTPTPASRWTSRSRSARSCSSPAPATEPSPAAGATWWRRSAPRAAVCSRRWGSATRRRARWSSRRRSSKPPATMPRSRGS